MLQPDIERKGLSGRFTANIGDNAQFYAMGNYYETETSASLTPLSFRGRPTNPIPAGLATYNVIAPVYVCATGAGTLNGLNTGRSEERRVGKACVRTCSPPWPPPPHKPNPP